MGKGIEGVIIMEDLSSSAQIVNVADGLRLAQVIASSRQCGYN
jgi:hypothetical protein